MSTEIKAPVFPESVAEGTIATWHKQPGEACSRDDLIVDIETDKVVLEVVAPADGVIEDILKGEGDTVKSGEVIGKFKEGAAGNSGSSDDSEARCRYRATLIKAKRKPNKAKILATRFSVLPRASWQMRTTLPRVP